MDKDDPQHALISYLVQREQQEAASSDGAAESLKVELQSLDVPALFKRAKAAGISTADLEQAMDKDDTKGTLVRWLMDHNTSGTVAQVARAQHAHLWSCEAEPDVCTLPELCQLAKQVGCKVDAVEDARKGVDVKSALIELIVKTASARKQSEADGHGLRQRCIELHATIEQLSAENQHSRHELQNKEEQEQRWQQENADLVAEIQRLWVQQTDTVAQGTSQADEDDFRALNATVDGLKSENARLLAELDSKSLLWEDEKRQMEQEISRLRATLDDLGKTRQSPVRDRAAIVLQSLA